MPHTPCLAFGAALGKTMLVYQEPHTNKWGDSPSHSSQLNGTTVPQPSTLRKLPTREAMLRWWCPGFDLQDSTANDACLSQTSPCERAAMGAACSPTQKGVPACQRFKCDLKGSTACQHRLSGQQMLEFAPWVQPVAKHWGGVRLDNTARPTGFWEPSILGPPSLCAPA